MSNPDFDAYADADATSDVVCVPDVLELRGNTSCTLRTRRQFSLAYTQYVPSTGFFLGSVIHARNQSAAHARGQSAAHARGQSAA